MNNQSEMITDYAGNTFARSRLNEMESPSFDPHGAAKDEAMKALPGMVEAAKAKQPQVGKTVKINENAPKKHRGKIGEVFWRGKNPIPYAYRYANSTFGDIFGLRDRIGIRMADGSKVFVGVMDADLV